MKRIPIKAMTLFSNQGSRSAQEDFALGSEAGGIFAVADGFGGAESGAWAARTACESLREYLEKEAGDIDATMPFVLRSYFSLAGNVLFNALVHANRKLINRNRKFGVHEKGGASCLAGYLDGDLLALANVGVCSAWLMREGQSVELVVPRSYGRLREPFRKDLDEAKAIPLMALGITDDLEPEIVEYRVRVGDWLILHTDGFSSSVRELLPDLQRQGGESGAMAGEIREVLQSCAAMDNSAVTAVIF